jgi:UDP-N-acetylmuramate--alanine ligase
MSNLARYFLLKGKKWGDMTVFETVLTRSLQKEGAFIHYEDDIHAIPASFFDKEKTLVVYTPAVPASHANSLFPEMVIC